MKSRALVLLCNASCQMLLTELLTQQSRPWIISCSFSIALADPLLWRIIQACLSFSTMSAYMVMIMILIQLDKMTQIKLKTKNFRRKSASKSTRSSWKKWRKSFTKISIFLTKLCSGWDHGHSSNKKSMVTKYTSLQVGTLNSMNTRKIYSRISFKYKKRLVYKSL